ncbi:MAG: YihY/virulence factor BrkB family protein [Pseudomonadota bacterium]
MRGMWRFGGAVWGRMGDSHFGLIAAGVAFYAMFAVFPGLTATVSIWSMVADPAVISGYLAVAERFLPTDVAKLLHDQVVGLMQTPRARLGWATGLSLAIALYSARAGVAALIQGMDVVHRAQPRSWLWGWAVDFAMTAALIVAFIVALCTVVVVPLVLNLFSLGAVEAVLLTYLPWGAMFLLVLTCLGILYRYGPNVGAMRDPWVSPGTVIAALAWAGVSIAFSAYLANFNSYNRIYGSIGAVIALLMWLYLSVWTVLLGAAVNAELSAPSGPRAG